ncbi:hypothetical protein J6590_080324 [Homalodisca vitripennis]|nr:hypothetical protein J6590_080324 [Homalodisca vitripennis]
MAPLRFAESTFTPFTRIILLGHLPSQLTRAERREPQPQGRLFYPLSPPYRQLRAQMLPEAIYSLAWGMGPDHGTFCWIVCVKKGQLLMSLFNVESIHPKPVYCGMKARLF